MNNKIQVGDMVRLQNSAIKKGRKSAICAWQHKREGRNLFSNQQPARSEDYAQWFEEIINSVGYCCNIDEEWIQVTFVHLQTPLWFLESNMKKV